MNTSDKKKSLEVDDELRVIKENQSTLLGKELGLYDQNESQIEFYKYLNNIDQAVICEKIGSGIQFVNDLFFSIFKILVSNLFTIGIFYFLINFFSKNLSYESNYKFLCIIGLVLFTFILYIFVSIVTKAFKLSDIKIKH